jgi:hypothetical protein
MINRIIMPNTLAGVFETLFNKKEDLPVMHVDDFLQ